MILRGKRKGRKLAKVIQAGNSLSECRLMHHCHILGVGSDSYRLKNSSTSSKETKGKKKGKT